MIVIVDYGMGNLRSVHKSLCRLEIESVISSNSTEIENAEKLILPGVGHFARGMHNIKSLGLWDVLNKKVLIDKTPILGICLGMQLFSKRSEEGDVEGFGWLDAETVRFKVSDTNKFKIPHIGWNSVMIEKDNHLYHNLSGDDLFYFVHSYHVVSYNREDVLSSTIYDYDFVSSIQKDTIYGTQFHPEKSHKSGMQILRNFAEMI